MPIESSLRTLGNLTFLALALLCLSPCIVLGESDTATGGTVTFLNITARLDTDCWAGYYGDIIEGSPSSPTVVNAFGGTVSELDITFDCSPINDSNYLLVTESEFSPTLSNLVAGSPSAIDSLVGNESDSGTNTFSSSASHLIAGTYLINSVPTFYPFINDSWQSNIFAEGFLNDTGDMVFAVSLAPGTWSFNNELNDYQMVLPTPCGGNKTYFFYIDTCLPRQPAFEEEVEEVPTELGQVALKYYILFYPEAPLNITPERAELFVDMQLHKAALRPLDNLAGTLYFNYTGEYDLYLRVALTVDELELYSDPYISVHIPPDGFVTKNFSFMIPLDAEDGFYNLTEHIMWGDRKANLSGTLSREFMVWTPPRLPTTFREDVLIERPGFCNCFLIACADVFMITMLLVAFSLVMVAFASLWKHRPVSLKEERHYSVYFIFLLAFSPAVVYLFEPCVALILGFVDIITCIIYYLSIVPVSKEKKPRRRKKKRREERKPRQRNRLTFSTFSAPSRRSRPGRS
ncbi:MAG: hypothetical protein JXB14_04930 [Candidatus Altiarchaeota archaeon]|nr:hypothetical protein [Candidatus Altiarchaeota archaeon]